MQVSPVERYDRTTIALHWIVAVIVIGQWTAGQTLDWLPKGPLRTNLWSTHVVFGFALTAILVARIVWRRTSGRHLPEVGTPIIRRVAAIVHVTLYVLLVAVVTVGVANAFNRGVDLYGIVKLPQIGDKELKHPLTDVHGVLANLLMIVAFVHASAALVHHFLWKDPVLARMLPVAVPKS